MAVNVPNPTTYLANLGSHVVAMRTAINDLLEDAQYLNTMGGATFLQGEPFNLNGTDATQIATVIGAVVPSNGTVQDIQAFIANATFLTGGQ